MGERKTASYKIIKDSGGNRYMFFCDLSGALVYTTKPYKADTPEAELLLPWEKEGKQHFNICHKCGKLVLDAMFNPEVHECVRCVPFEAESKYCKNCGKKIVEPVRDCPACGRPLYYEGRTKQMTQKTRFENMEDFGYGPNVMKNTKVCTKCGHVINASASYCPDCGEQLSSEALFDRYKRQHPCCPECDTVLAPGSLYCPNCGKQILQNAAGNEKGGG